ncbi:aminomethyl transferase family protein [Gammaproteobacteria bacterium]|nr:aminomethyl transferase family protein [Gammaproteobacteria bacterium]
MLDFNYSQIDQSDRKVPRNLRQSGPTYVKALISTRVRKSPFWHLSHDAGCWRATIYNRMYSPCGYVKPEDGGMMAEYDALVNGVTLWNVAIERQIRVKGPEAEAFTNYVVTRDTSKIKPGKAKYTIVCNEAGGILNDPVLLRIAEDEFWFSIADSDLMLWLQGVNTGLNYQVEIDEIDVSPLQVQGPLSGDFMADLLGQEVLELPFYGLMEAELAGASVVVSQTGFTGEKGYEIFVRDSHLFAEKVWEHLLDRGKAFDLKVISTAHHRRIAAGILSWGQDMDHESSPFQVNLDYQVPKKKTADYVGKKALEEQRSIIEADGYPFKMRMIGLVFGGKPVTDYAPDFWLIYSEDNLEIGYVTSPWWSPELETNIGLGWVHTQYSGISTPLKVYLPDMYSIEAGIAVDGEVVEIPFRESANPNVREKIKKSRKGSDI